MPPAPRGVWRRACRLRRGVEVFLGRRHRPGRPGAQRSVLALESPDIGAAERRRINERIGWWKKSSGAPLPGAPNVGSRVPAKPSRFEHWGAHEDLPPTDPRPSFTKISRANSTNLQHKGHEIYTGLGHRCGVIPYSSVVVVDCLLG